ncbi:hypothetical protein MMC25_000286 [Agyrium rufum]|nr:hypothetical protein [Agyrium rufum]
MDFKICVLGAQGAGKTSLVQRYVKGTFTPPTVTSTVGASFLTKRAIDPDSGTTVRLQIWDTAGQERFRSISKLYYRGASAVILVYSIVDEPSFDEMGRWLREVRENVDDSAIIHVVGTKSDVVAQDPGLRKIPFERCIAYVAEQLHPGHTSNNSPPVSAGSLGHSAHHLHMHLHHQHQHQHQHQAAGLDSKRNSGFWGQEIGWDTCHEISSKDGEGIDEVFQVITRKLVEERQRKIEREAALEAATPATEGGGTGYFDRPGVDGTGSFRLGHGGDKRRSWLGFPTPSIGITEDAYEQSDHGKSSRQTRCC